MRAINLQTALRGSLPVTKNGQQKVGEDDPDGRRWLERGIEPAMRFPALFAGAGRERIVRLGEGSTLRRVRTHGVPKTRVRY